MRSCPPFTPEIILKGADTMTEQEVFNMLAELEEYFYYRLHNPGPIPWTSLNEMHDEIKTLLLQWHTWTGCTNQ